MTRPMNGLTQGEGAAPPHRPGSGHESATVKTSVSDTREKGLTCTSDSKSPLHVGCEVTPRSQGHQCSGPSASPRHSPAAGTQTAVRRHRGDRPMLPSAPAGPRRGSPLPLPSSLEDDLTVLRGFLCNREEPCLAAGPGRASSLRAGHSRLGPGGRPGLTPHLP